MALSEVSVNKGSSGLGRRLDLDDGISALVFYNNTLPSGFSATERIKKVFSVDEAVLLGIAEGSANHDVEHYHISEFFRLNPSGSLYIGYFAVPVGAYDYSEVQTVQTFAKGEVSLFGVYAPARTLATAEITALQAIMTGLEAANEPAVAFLANDISAVSDLSAIIDARTVTAPDVSVRAGEDHAGRGADIATTLGTSVTDLGAILGAEARSSVAQSIALPEAFNLSGSELTVPGFANGQAYRDVSATLAAAVKDKGLGIIRDRLPGISGTYAERVPMAVSADNDYAFIENRRVVHKAQRLLVSVYAPKLNSSVILNSDGTLSNPFIEAFRNIGLAQLDGMVADGELSDREIEIDSSQNVLSTSTLVISAKLLPVGVAEFITININLVPEIT